ncbi:MAG: pimeloyl-ACP methyl ester carboxylesterase [Gammaproteobacteria bacterium]
MADSSHKLFSIFGKKVGLIISKLAPRWTRSQIDALIFKPTLDKPKSIRIPRGFKEVTLKLKDGNVNSYQIGNGPIVVFVHGMGGAGQQFFPLMRGLSQCGFKTITFDHLGHGKSDKGPNSLDQMIATTNQALSEICKKYKESPSCIVAHSTGCIAVANARHSLLKNIPLLLVSPIFNYKLFFLKKLVKLDLHSDILKGFATRFSNVYNREYAALDLAKNLEKYSDISVIVHDREDSDSPVSDSIKFTTRYPMTKILLTTGLDHHRVLLSESVWHELKSVVHYEDTTINFTQKILDQQTP